MADNFLPAVSLKIRAIGSALVSRSPGSTSLIAAKIDCLNTMATEGNANCFRQYDAKSIIENKTPIGVATAELLNAICSADVATILAA